ncbi:MAG: hypothetical protein L0G49_13795 [Luteococcus sp.]|uniref:hypothetical protein n=1 Tax=Luteococcus sp. TaxID=1969402 RepID=UPI0026497677|nr:hypothetical protein [Luteococcus sp.]MDN5564812.1 hypothetical protein [Luteococcus sp.]
MAGVGVLGEDQPVDPVALGGVELLVHLALRVVRVLGVHVVVSHQLGELAGATGGSCGGRLRQSGSAEAARGDEGVIPPPVDGSTTRG